MFLARDQYRIPHSFSSAMSVLDEPDVLTDRIQCSVRVGT
jgi:hypothetical protein